LSDKSCTENKNTHFMSKNIFENLAVYERMWGKNMVERGMPQMKP